MDAISLLKNDHHTVEQLFSRYEDTSDAAHETRRDLVSQIITELSVHASVEEQVFYPAVRLAVPATEDDVREALEEHHIVKWTLSELDSLDPADERFDAKVTVLIEAVRHHVEEEEGEMFPKVRDALDSDELSDLGDRLETAKQGAPTRPHPRSPDAPPGNLVSGAVAGVVDRARDLGRGAFETARDTIGDALGEARDVGEEVVHDARTSAGLSSSAPSRPSGTSTTARKTARKATGSAKKTARKASSAARKTAKKASGTAKKTARKASGSAKTTRKAGRAKKTSGSVKRSSATAKRSTKKASGSAKRSAKKASGSARKASSSAKKTAKRNTRKATAKRGGRSS